MKDMIDRIRFDKLPKYVQQEIEDLRHYVEQLEDKLTEMRKAHALLVNPELDWFTIGVHTPEKRKVYFLDKDHPNHVATIGAGSFIMIAHPNNKNKPAKG